MWLLRKRAPARMEALVLYDGECGLCNHFVRYVIARDITGIFSFAALQSDLGGECLRRHGLDAMGTTSIVVIDGGAAYLRSDAVLRVVTRLPGAMRLLVLGRVVPRLLRDMLYDLVAAHRHRVWTADTCVLPPPPLRERFRAAHRT